MEPGDFKMLAGPWIGSAYVPQTTFHETEPGWVCKWQGATPDGGVVRSEVTKSK